jgi:hypothetical protein
MSGLPDINGLRQECHSVGYKGKSSIATAAAMVLVYGAYFLWAARPGLSASELLGGMIVAIVALAVISAVFEIGVRLHERLTSPAARTSDERDALNAARGARNGYYALLSVIWIAPVMVLLGIPATFTANSLLGMIVFAEIVHFASRAAYDARGA